jgi:Protein of unknown function (DUF4232)
MKRIFSAAARCALAAAASCAAAGSLAGCGSATPSASPGRTVTVTVTAGPAIAASPATQPPASAPAGPPGCATSALTASLGAGNGAAGSTYYPIEFTNSSGSACTLYGFPGVSFVSAASKQVGAAATEDSTYPRQLVTLAPGASAHASLRVVDAGNYPSSACKPVTVQRLRVFPPNQTTALSISLAATACSNASVQILTVQTVQPASQ